MDELEAPATSPIRSKRRRRTAAEMLASGGRTASAQRQQDRYNESVEERVRQLIRTYRDQDKKAGRGKCDLDPDTMLARVQTGVCEVTGASLYLGPVGGGGQRKKRAFSFSFDRKNNSLPHTSANTQIVCSIYNIMKASYDEKEVEEFIEILRSSLRRDYEHLLRILRKIIALKDKDGATLQDAVQMAESGISNSP